MPHRNLLVCTLALLVVVNGSLLVTPPPAVRACNACNFLLTWGSPGSLNGQFDGPIGVAVDSSGNVYVADYSNSRVEKFTGTGTFITTWGSLGSGNGQFNGAAGVAVDSSGNVYVTDAGNQRVEKFTSTGTFILAWGSHGFGNGQFGLPYGVAVDSLGNVYVTDLSNDRVEKFTSIGAYITAWGCANAGYGCSIGSGNGQFSNPYGVAVDASANVYVADYGNSRVEKFTGTGTFITTWGSLGSGNGQFNAPTGVAVDSSGNVYVTDFRVQKFTSTGAFITAWGDGQFSLPDGVAVDSSGNVYVADWNNNRVELFGDSTLASIGLVAGWNLISLPLVPVNTAIGKVLNDLIVAHDFTIVWSYQGGAWKSFTPPSTGTLTSMVDGFGYWIYVTHPSTLNVLGYVILPGPSTPPTYSLSAGWNLLGFKPQPTLTSETVGTYLSSISGDYITNSVWIYDNPTGVWIRASSSTSIPVGEALWVYMTTPATLRP